MRESYKTIQGQVFHLLSEHPETRDNDGLLLVYWLRQFRGCESYAGILRLAVEHQLKFETVRRARQRIQKECWFQKEGDVSAQAQKAYSHRI